MLTVPFLNNGAWMGFENTERRVSCFVNVTTMFCLISSGTGDGLGAAGGPVVLL